MRDARICFSARYGEQTTRLSYHSSYPRASHKLTSSVNSIYFKQLGGIPCGYHIVSMPFRHAHHPCSHESYFPIDIYLTRAISTLVYILLTNHSLYSQSTSIASCAASPSPTCASLFGCSTSLNACKHHCHMLPGVLTVITA
jgi:hypothetical protein